MEAEKAKMAAKGKQINNRKVKLVTELKDHTKVRIKIHLFLSLQALMQLCLNRIIPDICILYYIYQWLQWLQCELYVGN